MKKLIPIFAGLLAAFTAMQASGAAVSGVTGYNYEAEPKGVTQKMYNWEVTLSAADSKKGSYDIVQVDHYLSADGKNPDATNVLIGPGMVRTDATGIIHFALLIGDKQPRTNMGGPGQIGEPIVYLGLGSSKVESAWITLPGQLINRTVPAASGTRLADDKLMLIEFDVTDKDGAKIQTQVMLRRELNPK